MRHAAMPWPDKAVREFALVMSRTCTSGHCSKLSRGTGGHYKLTRGSINISTCNDTNSMQTATLTAWETGKKKGKKRK